MGTKTKTEQKKGHFDAGQGVSYNIIGFTTNTRDNSRGGMMAIVCQIFFEGKEMGIAECAAGITKLEGDAPWNENWEQNAQEVIMHGLKEAVQEFHKDVADDVLSRVKEVQEQESALGELEKMIETARIEANYFENLLPNLAANDAISVVIDPRLDAEQVKGALQGVIAKENLTARIQDVVLMHVDANEEFLPVFNELFPKQANVNNVITKLPDAETLCHPCVMITGMNVMNSVQGLATGKVFVIGDPNQKLCKRAIEVCIDINQEYAIVPVFSTKVQA